MACFPTFCGGQSTQRSTEGAETPNTPPKIGYHQSLSAGLWRVSLFRCLIYGAVKSIKVKFFSSLLYLVYHITVDILKGFISRKLLAAFCFCRVQTEWTRRLFILNQCQFFLTHQPLLFQLITHEAGRQLKNPGKCVLTSVRVTRWNILEYFGIFPQAMQATMAFSVWAAHNYAHQQFLCSPLFFFPLE